MALPSDDGLLADDVLLCAGCGQRVRPVIGSDPPVYVADVDDVRVDRVACAAAELPSRGHRRRTS